jgi:hypothetical protein
MRGLSRRGTSLIEALVALLLGLIVVQGALTAAAKARVVHRRLVERADVLSSVRLTAAVLRAEVEAGIQGDDWSVIDDSLSLRAFRGTGLVCSAASSGDGLAVSWAGYRRPDPAKDSVWIASALGTVSVTGLVGVETAPDSCRAEPLDDGLVLRLSGVAPVDASFARVFERGAYSVTGAALRYRRGAGGRQPLTAEVFDAESGWRMEAGGLNVVLIERGTAIGSVGAGPTPRSWLIGVAGRAPR